MRFMQKSKNSILDPVTAYDAFAPYYQAYSERRLAYLKSVETIIGTYATGADSLLDVGAGDGSRISRIASSIKPREIVLVEPSKAMLARCNLRAESRWNVKKPCLAVRVVGSYQQKCSKTVMKLSHEKLLS